MKDSNCAKQFNNTQLINLKYTIIAKLKITQALSPKGNTYIIYQWNDKNTLDCFEIYKLVGNQKDVAREFGISDINPNGGENFNTRVMCEKMIDKIEQNNMNVKL